MLASFTSDYGKKWDVRYTIDAYGDVCISCVWINDIRYKVTSLKRQYTLFRILSNYINF